MILFHYVDQLFDLSVHEKFQSIYGGSLLCSSDVSEILLKSLDIPI